MILLSTLVDSVTVWNVWDLPLWAWMSYAQYHDDYVASMKEAHRG